MSKPQLPSDSSFHDFLHKSGYIDLAARYDHLKLYLDFFQPGNRVLDIGCGRGEFLELLRQKGCYGTGIDIDAGMIEACVQKGLSVVQGDVFDCLSNFTDYDGVFASNFIEHLSPEQALRFLSLVQESLKVGGVIVIGVPNPQSIVVHLHEFWRDLSHVRMYDRQSLEFMLIAARFEIVTSGINEATSWVPNIQNDGLATQNGTIDHLKDQPNTESLSFHLSNQLEKRQNSTLSLPRRLFRNTRRRIARFLVGDIVGDIVEDQVEPVRRRLAHEIQLISTLALRLTDAVMFFFPPREVYVVGRKVEVPK